jgi:hypothetical protein
MLVTPDNAMLIVAESYAKRLSAFHIAADGNLAATAKTPMLVKQDQILPACGRARDGGVGKWS